MATIELTLFTSRLGTVQYIGVTRNRPSLEGRLHNDDIYVTLLLGYLVPAYIGCPVSLSFGKMDPPKVFQVIK
jgi:hypothetical protein